MSNRYIIGPGIPKGGGIRCNGTYLMRSTYKGTGFMTTRLTKGLSYRWTGAYLPRLWKGH